MLAAFLSASQLVLAQAPDGDADPQSTSAEADEQANVDAARRLFWQGVELASDGLYRDAADAFRQADALHSAASIRFNLAAALWELEDDAEALALLEAISQEEDPDIYRRAQSLRADLISRLGVIEVTAVEEIEFIEIDGRRVQAGRHYARPGEHLVQGVRNETVVARERIVVAAEETANVQLSLPGGASAVAAGVLPNEDGSQLDVDLAETDSEGLDTSLVVGLAVGGAALVIGIVTLIVLTGGGSVEEGDFGVIAEW